VIRLWRLRVSTAAGPCRSLHVAVPAIRVPALVSKSTTVSCPALAAAECPRAAPLVSPSRPAARTRGEWTLVHKLRRRLLARRRLAWGMLRNMGRRPSVRTALPRGARRTPAILYGHRETDWRFESRAARAVRPVAGLRINNGGSRWSPPSSYRMSSGPARSGSKLPSSRKAPSSLSWVFASV
jgi:hypothetical protein